jgi:4'-phosphopantetheinyl transferase
VCAKSHPYPRPDAAAAGDVLLWMLPVPLGAVAELDLSVLDAAERQRMTAMAREEDRREFGFSHVALRTVLGAVLGAHPRSLRFGRSDCPRCAGPHGRPVLADAGPVQFSLSHGGGLTLIAVASAPVGVDVEPYPRAGTVAEVTPLLHPAEQAEVRRAPESRRAAAFARAWVRKEAYLKGLGVGVGADLAADDLTTEVPGWFLTEVPTVAGCAAALAVRSDTVCQVGLRHSLPRP